jgi:hypothetical protein
MLGLRFDLGLVSQKFQQCPKFATTEDTEAHRGIRTAVSLCSTASSMVKSEHY